MPSLPKPDAWVARAQVWLGTLVEVALPPCEASEARFATAFAAIADVHRTMSAHEVTGDLARIARESHVRTVFVHGDTWAVLELAQRLWRDSRGAFDITIAPVLARAGRLPIHASGRATRAGLMEALTLIPGLGVRSAVPVGLDLGGIAKGHAVDRAVAALRAAGACAGRVNAGGDLRAFGDNRWMPVLVRHPATPARSVHLLDLCDAAVATSADYFRDGRSDLVDPRSQCVQPFAGSVTVVAPTCALADGLTKVVALCGEESAGILARHGAHAFMLGDDATRTATTCAAADAATSTHLRLPVATAA